MGIFFNKDRGNKEKDQNAVRGALEDAGQALKGDPLKQPYKKRPLP
ncbi:small, acid-soluble spore protein, SspJ family [Bacillus licheniformis]|nr:small, acid-soluble spore protein, SspJ family [Bacillus licheniformis]